jgi:RimJ/RimL family protein N-acetyltransferase
MTSAYDEIRYQRFIRAETELLADFLTSQPWPFHSGTEDRTEIRQAVTRGYYDGDSAHTYWIMAGGERVGLIRLFDLADSTPMLDLRIRTAYRGRGIGGQALAWLTEHVFAAFPGAFRIEGTTRQDNVAMRRVFSRAGWVKEAHYRDAWPGQGGARHDAIGYAILRRDWESGTTTVPRWDDEPA